MHVFFAFLLLLLTIVNVTAQAGTKLKFLAPRGTFNNVTALKLCGRSWQAPQRYSTHTIH